MGSDIVDRQVPPYVPVETFLELIKHLKATAVPGRIDKSMMPSDWPTLTRGQVQSALRFLKLVDDKGVPVAGLREVVEAFETDVWGKAVANHFLPAYADIIGDLVLATATQHQLDEKFSNVGVNGQMLPKSIRFYLALLKAGNVPFSPHLLAKRTSTSGPRKKAVAKAKSTEQKTTAEAESTLEKPPTRDQKTPLDDGHHNEMRKYPLYFRSKATGSLVVPSELTAADCDVIELQLKVLRLVAESK